MSCIKYIHIYNSKTDAIKIKNLASLAIYRIFNLGTLILVKIQWYNELCFHWKAEKVVTSSIRFSQERRWRQEKQKCVWSKIWKRRNYVELRDRWQKRGLSSLFTVACIYFSCTCSLFHFAFDLTTSLGMKKIIQIVLILWKLNLS